MPTTPAEPATTWRSVTSLAGTEIAYATLQAGETSSGAEPLVILHGSMQSALSQLELGRHLAAHHTVHLVERRSRGRSGAGEPGTDAEVADLLAVLDATGSTQVLGISSGAILALRAAEIRSGLTVLAFEPPLIADGSLGLEFLDRFDSEYAAGDLDDYLVTAMVGAELGPPGMDKLPRPVLRWLTRRFLAMSDRRSATTGAPSMRELAPALVHDFTIVRENVGRTPHPADAELILINGTRTRPYLRAAVDRLAAANPGARRVTLDRLDHGATGNRADRGRPDLVAAAVQAYLR
jgi:hypothetical protein